MESGAGNVNTNEVESSPGISVVSGRLIWSAESIHNAL